MWTTVDCFWMGTGEIWYSRSLGLNSGDCTHSHAQSCAFTHFSLRLTWGKPHLEFIGKKYPVLVDYMYLNWVEMPALCCSLVVVPLLTVLPAEISPNVKFDFHFVKPFSALGHVGKGRWFAMCTARHPRGEWFLRPSAPQRTSLWLSIHVGIRNVHRTGWLKIGRGWGKYLDRLMIGELFEFHSDQVINF